MSRQIVAAFILLASGVAKAESKTMHFVVPDTSGPKALNIVSQLANSPILYPNDFVEAIRVEGFECQCTVEGAVSRILEGHNLALTRTKFDVYIVASTTDKKVDNMNNFKKRALAMGIASTGILGGSLANSQESAAEVTPQMEEVVVTGIRASVQKAMDRKRTADVVVDGIAAEDLGKFPDQNIAESLQRIPGVSINRQGGEGRSITARGFGPEFNAVLFNGRILATETSGRSFSFDVFAADIINGAEAYKTTTANTISGGIGATVNLTTAKPMDYQGFKSSLTLKSTEDTIAKSTNPTYSGAFSYSNDTWGVLLSANHSERDYRTDSIYTRGWQTSDNHLDGGVPRDNVSFAGAGDPTQTIVMPRTLRADIDEGTRTRSGGTVAFQFAPSDNLTFTLDGLYSKFDVDTSQSAHGAWTPDWAWGAAGVRSVNELVIDENQSLVGYTLNDDFRDGPVWPVANSMVHIENNRFAKTSQLGFNVDWQVADNINVVYDYSTSTAENNAGGTNRFFSLQDRAAPARVDFSTAFPSWTPLPYTDADGNFVENSFGDPIEELSSQTVVQGGDVSDEIDQHRIDVTFDLDHDAIRSVSAGVYISSREKGQISTRNSRDDSDISRPGTRVYRGTPITIQPGIVTVQDRSDFFNGQYVDAFRIDIDAIIDFYNSDEAINQLPADVQEQVRAGIAANPNSPLGFLTPYEQLGDRWSVQEDIFELYAKVDFGGDNWFGNLGLRYAGTDVKSFGNERILIGLERAPVDTSRVLQTFADEITEVSAEHSYDRVLPSMNLGINLSEDQILRFGASKSITRPTLNQLNPIVDYSGGGQTELANRIVSSENPELEAFESTNFDISYEWYFGDLSYFSTAWFQKNTSGFLAIDTSVEDLLPGNEFGLHTVNRPRNGESAELQGIEFSFQHTLESGFGLQANATFVDPEQEFDLQAAERGEEQEFTLEGLSDSANLILFYENDRFQGRIAYNWRDEFLAERQNRDTGTLPVTQEAYSQVDISASYDITDNIQVLFQGVNVTEETQRSYQVYKYRLRELSDNGARYSVGIRATF